MPQYTGYAAIEKERAAIVAGGISQRRACALRVDRQEESLQEHACAQRIWVPQWSRAAGDTDDAEALEEEDA